MRTQRRLYAGPADLRAMQALAQRLWSPASRFHLGDLGWARYQHLGREPEWRTALWEHDGRLVAWAWARPPGSLDLQFDPGHPELADDILRWFDEVAPGSERVVTVLDAETELIGTLQSHGYRERRDGPFFVHMLRDLDGLAEPEVPDGYTLRPVRGADDAGARAAVHRAAFSLPGQPPSRVIADSYLQVMRAGHYRGELDWLVEGPGGAPAAFCLVWLDDHNRTAILEPVGTAPGHRRRGLASAAVLAALRAAHRLGAESARVCARGDDDYPSARATYASVGFQPYARNLTFSRGPLPAGGGTPPPRSAR